MIKCVKCKYSHDVVMEQGKFVFKCEKGFQTHSVSELQEYIKNCNN